MIELRTARLEYTPGGAITHFPDGSRWGALPHHTPGYYAIAHRLGYEDDIVRYAQEHDLAHLVISEHFGHTSPTLWALAHGEEPSAMIAAAEEALTLALQRYARTNEHPMIDRIPWQQLRKQFLSLAENAHENRTLLAQAAA